MSEKPKAHQPPFQADPVPQAVESLCRRGCAAVREIIIELEAGRPVAETEALSVEQRRRVLAELKAIMAVYDEPGAPGDEA